MSKKHQTKLNNQGISLVEIVIVIAIMAIIGGAVLLSTTVATDKQVTSCAEKVGSSLEQIRNLVMGKSNGYIEISQSPGDYVYVQMYVDGNAYGDKVSVGHPGLEVRVFYIGGAPEEILTARTPVKIYFSRSNGSIRTDMGDQVSRFEITNGRRTMEVKIDSFTGRIEVNRL